MLAGLTSKEEREDLEARVRYLRQRGRPVPEDIQARTAQVAIDDEHLDMWQAFAELSRSRGLGMGPCPIACCDVEAWCRMHGVPGWRRPTFWRVLRAVDDVFLAESTKLQRVAK